jgi:hypothetical protein
MRFLTALACGFLAVCVLVVLTCCVVNHHPVGVAELSSQRMQHGGASDDRYYVTVRYRDPLGVTCSIEIELAMRDWLVYRDRAEGCVDWGDDPRGCTMEGRSVPHLVPCR